MRRPLAGYQVIGGMRPAEGKAAFARGAAVLKPIEGAGPYAQVHGYGQQEVDGTEVDAETWRALQSSGQALELRNAVPVQREAALWVLRPGFDDREDAFALLSQRGALLHKEEIVPRGPVVAVVREDLGNPVRDVLALQRFDRAWEAALAGRWPEALVLADLAFVLSRGLVVERVALLALALERVGRKTASDGQIEMAAGSRGAAFGQAVRDKKAEFAATCHAAASAAPKLASTGGRRYFRQMFGDNKLFLRSAFENPEEEAAA